MRPIDKALRPLDAEHDVKPAIGPTNPTDVITNLIRNSGSSVETADHPHDDDFGHIRLSNHLKNLAIDPVPNRFFGNSSGMTLIRTAVDLKHEYTGQQKTGPYQVLSSGRPEFWTTEPVRTPKFLFLRRSLTVLSSGKNCLARSRTHRIYSRTLTCSTPS
jgi:hypothetical protein